MANIGYNLAFITLKQPCDNKRDVTIHYKLRARSEICIRVANWVAICRQSLDWRICWIRCKIPRATKWLNKLRWIRRTRRGSSILRMLVDWPYWNDLYFLVNMWWNIETVFSPVVVKVQIKLSRSVTFIIFIVSLT